MASAWLARRALVLGVAAGPVVVVLPLSDQFALPKLAFGLIVAAIVAVALPPALIACRLRLHPLPPLIIAVSALVLVAAALASDHPRASILGTYADYSGVLSYVPGIVCFLAAAALIRSVHSVERLASAMSFAAIPVLAYALVQAAGLGPVDWDQDFGGRVFSTLGQPLVLGGYSAMLLPMLVWLALRRQRGERAFLLGEAGVALAVLALSGTRGAWLAAVVSALVLGALLARNMRLQRSLPVVGAASAALVLTLVAGFAFAPDGLRSPQTLDERIDLWRGSIMMAAERPLLGWGPDQFAVNYGMFRPSEERGTQSPYEQPAATPHNELLTLLVAGGFPLAVLYIGLWSVAVAAAFGVRSPSRSSAVSWLLSALAAYAVQAQFSIPDVALHVLAMTLLGSLVGLTPTRMRARRSVALPPIARLPQVGGAALLVTVAVVLLAADAVHAVGMRAHPASEEAVSRLRAATRINPLQAQYFDDLALARELRAPASRDPHGEYAAALDLRQRRIQRFGGTVAHHLEAARVARVLRPVDDEAANAYEHHLDEARRLDPRNPGLERAIADIAVE
jgi:O-antigen ligase